MFRRRQEAPPALEALIVGLGNPGGQYAATRHNVGWRVVDLLAERAEITLRRSRFKGRLGMGMLGGKRLALLQPTTYMNNSGEAVAPAAHYYRIPPERVLVICDDVHLELGRLRLRRGGSAGGHKGLESIIRALGTSDFPRLRLGVGNPEAEVDRVGFVLGRFRPEEMVPITEAIRRAAEAAEVWLTEGLEAAANRFNAPLPQDKPQQQQPRRQPVEDKGVKGAGAQPAQQEGDGREPAER